MLMMLALIASSPQKMLAQAKANGLLKALMIIFPSEGFSVLGFRTSLHRIGRKTPSDCEIFLMQ
jgi:hypothetical protein